MHIGEQMRYLKLLTILFVMGCAEDVEKTPAVPLQLPIFVGPCSRSYDLRCQACLYTYQGRYMILCNGVK